MYDLYIYIYIYGTDCVWRVYGTCCVWVVYGAGYNGMYMGLIVYGTLWH